jgi:hypothetical protein
MWAETGIQPAALVNRPELPEDYGIEFNAWQELDGSRPPAFEGIKTIPYSEVVLYAQTHGYRGWELNEFWEKVHLLDLIYCDQRTSIAKAMKTQTNN